MDCQGSAAAATFALDLVFPCWAWIAWLLIDLFEHDFKSMSENVREALHKWCGGWVTTKLNEDAFHHLKSKSKSRQSERGNLSRPVRLAILAEKVWKRDTFNLDDGKTGKLIAEELISDMTRKDLNRPLPEGVKNIRTVLPCKTLVKSDDKVQKSRKELVEFSLPAEPPPDKVKLKAKSTPISSQQVMNSQGEKRAKWIQSIEKELASFKNNHATEVINPELREKCRQVGNYPLPTQMVFVESQTWRLK
eukprot:4927274-Amphidinium_carterae.3